MSRAAPTGRAASAADTAAAVMWRDPWVVALIAAIGMLYLAPSSRLALVPLAVAVVAGLHRPATLLALIPATFPFYDFAAPGSGLRLDRSALLVGVAAVAAAGHLLLVALPAFAPALARPARLLAGEPWTREEIRALPGEALAFVRRPAVRAALALLLLGAVSLLTVADPTRRGDSVRQFRVVIVLPVLWFLLAAACLVGTRRRTVLPAPLLLAADALVFGGVVVALAGVAQFVGGSALGVEGVRRASGLLRHPNEVALYVGRVVPFAAAFALFGPDGIRRTLYRAASVSLLLGVGLSFSRGGYLAVAAALFVVLVATGRRRPLFAFAGVVVAVFAAGLASGAERFTRLLEPERGSGGLRLDIWGSTAAMLRDHPVWGVGLDQFLMQYAPRYVAPSAWPERFTAHPHNIVLHFYAALGVLGLAWLVFVVPPLLMRGWRAAMHLRAAGEPARFALALGGVAALVDIVAHGLVDQAYFLHMLAYTFWFVVLVIGASGGRPHPPAPSPLDGEGE